MNIKQKITEWQQSFIDEKCCSIAEIEESNAELELVLFALDKLTSLGSSSNPLVLGTIKAAGGEGPDGGSLAGFGHGCVGGKGGVSGANAIKVTNGTTGEIEWREIDYIQAQSSDSYFAGGNTPIPKMAENEVMEVDVTGKITIITAY